MQFGYSGTLERHEFARNREMERQEFARKREMSTIVWMPSRTESVDQC